MSTNEELSKIIIDYLNSNKDTDNGRFMNNVYENEIPYVEKDQDAFNKFINKIVSDTIKNKKMDANNEKQKQELIDDLTKSKKYLTIDNDKIKYDGNKLQNATHEYNMYISGDKHAAFTEYLHNYLNNSNVLYNLAAQLYPNNNNIYNISVITTNEYKDRVEELLSQIDTTSLLGFPNSFGRKINDFVHYNAYVAEENSNINSIVGRCVYEAIKDYVLSHNTPEHTYMTNTENDLRQSVKEISLVEPNYLDNIIMKTIEYLNENNINITNIFTVNEEENEYKMIISCVQPKIVHENLSNEFTNMGEIQEHSNLHKVVEESIDRAFNPKEIHESISYIDLDEDLEQINQLPKETHVEENEINDVSEIQENNPIIENPLYEKYMSVIDVSLINNTINGMNVLEVLEQNDIFNLIPLDTQVYLDDEYKISGSEFIKNNIIPTMLRLQNPSVTEVVEMFSTDYYNQISSSKHVRVNKNKNN